MERGRGREGVSRPLSCTYRREIHGNKMEKKKIQGLLLYNSERLSPREKREGNLGDMQRQRTTAAA